MPTKQKSGLYRAKVRLGDKDGKPVYKYISGKTKAELEKARREIIEVYVEGRYASKRLLFDEYLDQWIETCLVGSSVTVKQRTYLINRFIRPKLGKHSLRSITAMDLQEIINDMAKRNLSRAYMLTVKQTICIVFRDALADRVIDHDPSTRLTVRDAPEKKRTVRPLTEEERVRYLQYADEHPSIQLFLYILYYTGVRIGEALGFQWGDIDWANHTISVNRDIDEVTKLPSTLKTKNAYRSIPIPPQLYAVLQANRGTPTAHIVTGYLGRQTYPIYMRMKFAAAMRELGIEGVTPHSMRHNYITMCYEAGIDCAIVTRVVGHASYAITQDVYTHLSETIKRKTDQQIVAMFR